MSVCSLHHQSAPQLTEHAPEFAAALYVPACGAGLLSITATRAFRAGYPCFPTQVQFAVLGDLHPSITAIDPIFSIHSGCSDSRVMIFPC